MNPRKGEPRVEVGWELDLRADGRFRLLTDDDMDLLCELRGRYTVKGDELLLRFDGGRRWSADSEVSPNRLTLTFWDERPDWCWRIVLERSSKPIPALRKLPPLPRTLQEATALLISELPPADREYVLSVPEEDLDLFHFSWGVGIRNGLGLWRGNRELLRSCGSTRMPPDEASRVIIHAVWRTLSEQASPELVRALDRQNNTSRAVVLGAQDFEDKTLSQFVGVLNERIGKFIQAKGGRSGYANFRVVLGEGVDGNVRTGLESIENRRATVADYIRWVSFGGLWLQVLNRPPEMILRMRPEREEPDATE